MLLMLFHEFVDYNLFIPANMAFFAFFAGLFFHEYDESVDKNSRGYRNKHLEDGFSKELPQGRIRTRVKSTVSKPEKNPFYLPRIHVAQYPEPRSQLSMQLMLV